MSVSMLTSNYDHKTITLGLKCFVHCNGSTCTEQKNEVLH